MVEGMDVISGQPEDGHLCDEDAQQHGQRVNIGVGEGWVVGAGELVGEGKRWWALRRAGDAYVYANLNPTYLSASTAAKFLLPLSLTMLNNDPLLTQTQGY